MPDGAVAPYPGGRVASTLIQADDPRHALGVDAGHLRDGADPDLGGAGCLRQLGERIESTLITRVTESRQRQTARWVAT